MGIYDREYARDDEPGFRFGGQRMLVTNLVLITVGIYLVDLLFFHGALQRNWMQLRVSLVEQPWRLYGLLTYGFAHNPDSITHVLFNMIGLWFFGRALEETYGRREFLWFYLTAIIFSGLFWLLATLAAPHTGFERVIGASGGVVAVVILFALHFPKQTVLLFGVLPVPAWVLGMLYVVQDLLGAINPQTGDDSKVAFTAHLGGALFAAIYFKTHFSLGALLPGGFSLKKLRPKPKLRVHDPDPDKYEEEISLEVDRILEKIQQHGQGSLTSKEQKTLERASRRYQQKHR
ncbi:MAG: rhomboid family intramembrane serine protease [Planctomycetales bacterium]|nr:rhomboid family intramembrane serine protease [Planctomycetales bacterium]